MKSLVMGVGLVGLGFGFIATMGYFFYRSSFKGMGEVNTQIKPCSTFAEQESRCNELSKKDQCINCYVFGAEAKIAPKEEPRKATKEEKLNLKLALQR